MKQTIVRFIGVDIQLFNIEYPLVDFNKNNYIHWSILKGEFGTDTTVFKCWYNLGKKVEWIKITNEEIDYYGIDFFLNKLIEILDN